MLGAVPISDSLKNLPIPPATFLKTTDASVETSAKKRGLRRDSGRGARYSKDLVVAPFG